MSNLRFIGLDVHKDSIVMSVAETGAAEAKVFGTFPNDINKVLKQFKKLSGDLSLLRVCYEAGPTGFGLSRRLKEEGIDCIVVAPSLVPQKAGLRVKTDRRDSKKLAHYLRSGDLTQVWVPDPQTEALRDLERTRDDAKNAERRARHQLSKFLLRNDRAWRDGREWTVKHMDWVRKQKFDDACRQCVMDDYVKAVEDATARVKQLMKHVENFVEGHALQPLVKALMSFRGIQILSATVIAAEIGDLRRFKTARQFMAFLGLVPSEQSSGGSVKRGSLTKTGNGHVRRILVEAAQHYRHRPVLSAALRKRQEGISKEVLEISWEAQQRLCSRLTHFTNSGKARNKAIVALARELAGFIWSLGQVSQLLA
ncbi:MAG: IS110 family transposase [Fuerstia sp.]|nr:IS110 family transposase [Fuerstiella sp.]